MPRSYSYLEYQLPGSDDIFEVEWDDAKPIPQDPEFYQQLKYEYDQVTQSPSWMEQVKAQPAFPGPTKERAWSEGLPVSEPTQEWRRTPSFSDIAATTSLRTIPSIGGAMVGGGAGLLGGPAAPVTSPTGAMAGGAIGAGIGDIAAQGYEKAFGLRKGYNPWLTASETAVGAIPFGKATSVPRIAAKGAAIGELGLAGRTLAEEGRMPNWDEAIQTGALGAVIPNALLKTPAAVRGASKLVGKLGPNTIPKFGLNAGDLGEIGGQQARNYGTTELSQELPMFEQTPSGTGVSTTRMKAYPEPKVVQQPVFDKEGNFIEYKKIPVTGPPFGNTTAYGSELNVDRPSGMIGISVRGKKQLPDVTARIEQEVEEKTQAAAEKFRYKTGRQPSSGFLESMRRAIRGRVEKEGPPETVQEAQARLSGLAADDVTPAEVAFNAMIPERLKPQAKFWRAPKEGGIGWKYGEDYPVETSVAAGDVEAPNLRVPEAEPGLPSAYAQGQPDPLTIDPRLPLHYQASVNDQIRRNTVGASPGNYRPGVDLPPTELGDPRLPGMGRDLSAIPEAERMRMNAVQSQSIFDDANKLSQVEFPADNNLAQKIGNMASSQSDALARLAGGEKGSFNLPDFVKLMSANIYRRTLQGAWESGLVPGTGKSMERRLVDMGDAGKEVAERINRTVADRNAYASNQENIYEHIYESLAGNPKATKAEKNELWANLFDVIAGRAQPANPRVAQAVPMMQALQQERITKAQAVGLKMGKAELAPNYTPLEYPRGFWNNNVSVAEAIQKRFPYLDALSAEKIAKGQDIDVSNFKTFKDYDLLTDLMLVRKPGASGVPDVDLRTKLMLPGYRKDLNSWKQYAFQFANRAFRQEHLNSPEGLQALAATPEPRTTKEIIDVSLNRPGGRFLDRENNRLINSLAGKFAAVKFLGQFVISNWAGINPPMVMRPKETSTALGQAIQGAAGVAANKLSRGNIKAQKLLAVAEDLKRQLIQSGSAFDITGGILEGEASRSAASKWMGISWAENSMRTITTAAGRQSAKHLFDKVQAGNATKSDIAFLRRLILEDPTKIKQLSDTHLNRAGYRFSELTQGTAEPKNMPPSASSDDVWRQFGWMFKKYAYQGTKIFKDMITDPNLTKAEKTKNLAAMLAMGQISGYILGETKAVMRGTVREGWEKTLGEESGTNWIQEERERRANYLMKTLNKVPGYQAVTKDMEPENRKFVALAFDNFMQGWILGIVSDLFTSTFNGPTDMVEYAVGPVPMFGAKTIDAAVRGNTDFFKREAAKTIPYGLGPGLQRAWFPTNAQR